MSKTLFTRACLAIYLTLAAAGARARGDEAMPRWFRGNLHTHSLWSDGNDYPEMICDWYKEHGYHFLTLSDHNILSRGEKWIDSELPSKRGADGATNRYVARFGDDWVETRERDGKMEVRLKTLDEFGPKFDEPGRFLMIQSEEITDHFESLPIHVNATNLQELIRPQGGKSVRETISNNLIAVQQQSRRYGRPMLAHLNHPNFGYAVTAEDMAHVLEERFFEVYNGHPGVNHLGDKNRMGTERMWDVANTLRIAELNAPPLFGLATDDSHNYFGQRGASPGRGWVMVLAEKLDAESIVDGLSAGRFYASSGVELNGVSYDAGRRTIELTIAARPGATYITEFIGTPRDFDRTSAEVVGDDGKPIRATRRYSDSVGKVFATVEGTTVRYQLTGEELYVRAVVTSSEAAENPSFEGQRQQAWTQPVGWKLRSEKKTGGK